MRQGAHEHHDGASEEQRQQRCIHPALHARDRVLLLLLLLRGVGGGPLVIVAAHVGGVVSRREHADRRWHAARNGRATPNLPDDSSAATIKMTWRQSRLAQDKCVFFFFDLKAKVVVKEAYLPEVRCTS